LCSRNGTRSAVFETLTVTIQNRPAATSWVVGGAPMIFAVSTASTETPMWQSR